MLHIDLPVYFHTHECQSLTFNNNNNVFRRLRERPKVVLEISNNELKGEAMGKTVIISRAQEYDD